eukprot:TRINITY_DN1371_c0_g1_i2.p1 TRINITY_DN1371_c0_g1~~TRINITY_DN1371_c0_g1_i2.p1  ORF type:complete len:498 (-),score=125.73 TRINITY_DN1371_c0_g1_i2:116-1609(-)
MCIRDRQGEDEEAPKEALDSGGEADQPMDESGDVAPAVAAEQGEDEEAPKEALDSGGEADQPMDESGDVAPAVAAEQGEDEEAPKEALDSVRESDQPMDESAPDSEGAEETDETSKKRILEDLFGGESSDEEPAEPVKKRKKLKKKSQVESEDAKAQEGADAPADNNNQGEGDDFIDDEGVPDHLRFDDGDQIKHFQGDSDDDADPGSEEESHRPLAGERDALDTMMGLKKQKRKKATDDAKVRMAQDFIARMHEAADADEDSLRHDEPAIGKLRLLSEVQHNLLKKDMQSPFLENNCLLALKRFLELLPSGEHPNTTVRTAVLKIVAQLPVETFQLEKSTRGVDDTTLAEEVYRMASDKKETRENRRLAQKVVEEWYRKISGSSTNQRELARVDEERFREEPVEPRKLEAQDEGRIGVQMHKLAVKVPKKAQFDYRVRPESDPTVRARAAEKISNKKGTGLHDRLKTKMVVRAKASKKGDSRAETCSIEGRNMHKQ